LYGALGGNLDGGLGINTLAYGSYAAWHGVPFDLAHNIAPLVGRGVRATCKSCRIEMTGVSNQQLQAGVPIASNSIPESGWARKFRLFCHGMPAGLAIASNTGLITGTLLESAVSDTPYAIHVSANDGFNTAVADFSADGAAGSGHRNPGTQSQSARNVDKPGAARHECLWSAAHVFCDRLPAGLSTLRTLA